MTPPSTIAALERIGLGHWLPSTCEPLGPWVLRAHHGFTGRANSVLALGDPVPALNRPLAAVLDTVRAFDAGRELFVSAPEQVFLSLRDAGRTVAVARGSLSEGWAGVTAVEVAEDYRRRGLPRLLLAEISRWAAERGATSAFLQAAAANGPAHTLYLSAGLTVHQRYDCLTSSG